MDALSICLDKPEPDSDKDGQRITTPTRIHKESTINKHHRSSSNRLGTSSHLQPSHFLWELGQRVVQLSEGTLHSFLSTGLLRRLVHSWYHNFIHLTGSACCRTLFYASLKRHFTFLCTAAAHCLALVSIPRKLHTDKY